MDSRISSTRLNGNTNSGFTVVELLVTLAIIGVLVAILLPAVQQAREASRRTQCQNQLRQVGLACVEFESSYRNYPPGWLFGGYGIGPDSTAWSVFAQLLPFLDQTPLYTKGGIPKSTLRASGIAGQQLGVFLCPTDPGSNSGPRFDAGNMVSLNFAVGQTNYKAVCGANWGADNSQGVGITELGSDWINIGTNGSYDGLDQGDGMLYRVDYPNPRRTRDVVDGLSNTFLFGEDVPKYDIYCSWPYANNVYSTCAIPPNLFSEPDPTFWPNVQGFRSLHRGGLSFSLGDGSVRFISESIDLSVYRAMATINGAEAVSLP